jgi:hypothetical protein
MRVRHGSIRLADVAAVAAPALVQAVDASSLEVLDTRVGDRRRALTLAPVLAVENRQTSIFSRKMIALINLLVQVARSLRAAVDWAGGLDSAVECGGDGVCEEMEYVRLGGSL